ncbi:MAG: hypothetical protein KTR35_07600 [Gammaproteobacteria bacterium]|nr:hypothetical protein [Gammaproteobacteria bacterium]
MTDQPDQISAEPRSNGMPGWMVQVVSGLQTGALTTLEPSKSVTVGFDSSNDIVLRSRDTQTDSVRLTHTADGVQVLPLSGSFGLSGRSEDVQQSQLIGWNDSVQLGDVELRIVKALPTNSIKQESDIPIALTGVGASANFRPPSANKNTGSIPSSTEDKAINTKRSRRPLILGLAAAAVVAIAFVLFQSTLLDPPAVQLPTVSEQLAKSPFQHLSVEGDADDRHISGYLSTHESGIEFDRWLMENQITIPNRVHIEAEIVEKVEDVFRVNDVLASISSLGEGSVEALTSESSLEKLAKLETMVKADVPQLVSLVIQNSPPAQAAMDEPQGTLDPGKRVAMVVSEEPAYLVTEDRSHYYVGSILPSGHRIESIENGQVSLQKGGETTLLKF